MELIVKPRPAPSPAMIQPTAATGTGTVVRITAPITVKPAMTRIAPRRAMPPLVMPHFRSRAGA